jgi:hypothetical protein
LRADEDRVLATLLFFIVVGAFGKRPTPGGFNVNADDFVVMPHTTYQRVYGMRVARIGNMGTLSSIQISVGGALPPFLQFSLSGGSNWHVTAISGTGSGNCSLTPSNGGGSCTFATPTLSAAVAVTVTVPLTLPATGTYTLFFNPDAAQTGSATITLYSAGDLTGPITADGTGVPVSIAIPGQNARLTFSGTAAAGWPARMRTS